MAGSIQSKTIHDILFHAGIHKVERTSHDETGSQYYRGIIGYRKGNRADAKGQLHADDPSLVSLSDTLVEFAEVKNKTTIDYILHDSVRSHFTRIQVVITPSSTIGAGEKPSVAIEHIDTHANSEAKNLTEQFEVIKDAVKTAFALDAAPEVTHKVTNNTQTKNTCGDRCVLFLLSVYPNYLEKQYNQKYGTQFSKEEMRDALLADENKMREFIAFLDEQAQQKAKKEAGTHAESSSSSIISAIDDRFFAIEDIERNKAIDGALSFLNNLKLWKDEESHPVTFKITEKKIDVDNNEAEFKFTAERNGTDLGSITLTRKDNEPDADKKTTTWTCTTTNSSVTEEQRFQLIAAESLALRLEGMNADEAKKIGIVELNESERGERKKIHPQSKFPFTSTSRPPPNESEAIALSQKEISLIKAHFDAGYKEVYYGKLKLTPKNTEITYLSLPTQHVPTADEPYATKLAQIYQTMIAADSDEKKGAAYTKLDQLISDLAQERKIQEGADELNNNLTPIIELAQQKLTDDQLEKLRPIITVISSCAEGNWMQVYDLQDSAKQANITAAIVTTAAVMLPSLSQQPDL